MDVGMAMPGLRQAVSDHRRLRRRLEALPWERDSDLGMDVLVRLRRPEDLADLAHDLPQLARQLAASPPDPDAHVAGMEARRHANISDRGHAACCRSTRTGVVR